MITPNKIVRTNRKTLSLLITKDGSLVVHAPKRVSMEYIENFIQEKEKWIIKKQTEVLKTKTENQSIITMDSILFLGQPHEVISIQKNQSPEITDKYIYIPYIENKEERKIFLKHWIEQQTAYITKQRIEFFSNLMSLDYQSLKIIKSINRWGTCSSEGKISFNYKLSMLPPKIIDYIVIHELAHLLEFNHSKKFYQVIESVMPGWAIQRKKLKEYSYLLSI